MKVYFICMDAENLPTFPVKIGVASNVRKRVNDLQTGCPWPLRIIAKLHCDSRKNAYALESRFHNLFSYKRMEGEWFWFKNEPAFHTSIARITEPVTVVSLPPWGDDSFNANDALFLDLHRNVINGR